MVTTPPSSGASTLVGRAREQALLRERFVVARDGHGGLVLVGGTAGIGKTALAEEACDEAARQGALVLVGRCHDLSEMAPYGLWVELFGRYQPTDGMPPLPEAFARRGAVGGVSSQATLFQHVLDFFTALAGQFPIVLLLDDLHWADPASLDLLRLIARSLGTLPILLLATYRSDELIPGHPLHTLLPVLVREAHAARCDLRPLTEGDLRHLVAVHYVLAPEDAVRLVPYLHRRSEGNPFFLGELTRTLEEERVLQPTADGWSLGDLTVIAVPLLLRQVIDGRLVRLGEEARQLLPIAAVIGQEIPINLWARVAETDENTLLAAVAQAGAAHIMDETGDGTRAIFTHALIREALYEGVRPSQRRRWHRRVGETLGAMPHPDPDAVASHYQHAGDARTATWLIKAGERAAQAYAWQTAAGRFEGALALMADDADPQERGWLLYHVGAYRRWTNPAACIAYLTDAERYAVIAKDQGLAALAIFTRGVLYCINGSLTPGLDDMKRGVAARRALSVTERAHLSERALAEDTGDKTDGQGKLVQWLATAGHFREAQIVGEHALVELGAPLRAEALQDPSLTDTYYGLAQAYAGLGLVEEALHAYQRTRQAYRAAGHLWMVGVTAQNEFRWTVSYRMDRPTELHRLLAEADDAYAHATDSVSGFQRRYPNALRLLISGQWAEARPLLLAGLNHGGRAVTRQWLSAIAQAQGDTALAWELVHATLPDGPASEPGSVGFHTAVALLRVAARLALDAGEFGTAKSWLETHDRWVCWSESPLGRADGELLWAAYYRASGDGVRAFRHAEQALKEANNPRQPLALLEAHRLLGELETDAGHVDAAQTHLATALALADTCAVPFERANTLLACATLHAARGEQHDALAVLEEVRALCLPLGAAPTLASADALAARITCETTTRRDHPAGLSSREVEVLRLIAAGKTNREIADALFLSANTVRVHVRNIMTKTDTENRTAAVAFARDHGLV